MDSPKNFPPKTWSKLHDLSKSSLILNWPLLTGLILLFVPSSIKSICRDERAAPSAFQQITTISLQPCASEKHTLCLGQNGPHLINTWVYPTCYIYPICKYSDVGHLNKDATLLAFLWLETKLIWAWSGSFVKWKMWAYLGKHALFYA